MNSEIRPNCLWSRLPEELVIRIARYAALPDQEPTAASRMSASTRNVRNDSTLLSIDRASRRAYQDVISKKFIFAKILSYPCSAGKNCRSALHQSFEDLFGPAHTDDVLLKSYKLGHVNLTTLTMVVTCEHSRDQLAGGVHGELVAFFSIDDYRTLLLCSLLQHWEPLHIEVDIQRKSQELVSRVAEFLKTFACFVYDKDVSIIGQGKYEKTITSQLRVYQYSMDFRIMSTPEDLIFLLSMHSGRVQDLIDQGYHLQEVVPQAMVFLQANQHVITRIMHQHKQPKRKLTVKAAQISLNYGCLALTTIFEYLLERPMTVEQQRHHMIASPSGEWLCSALTSTRYPAVLRGCQADSMLLRNYFPVFKTRAQFYIAFARLTLLSPKEGRTFAKPNGH